MSPSQKSRLDGLLAGAASPAAFALVLAVAGALPHLVFSLSTGGLHFFKNAFDEDTYLDLALHGPWWFHRYVSSALQGVLARLFAADLDALMITMDVVLPAFIGWMAMRLGYALFRSRLGAIAFALSFVFGQELISQGSLAVWQNSAWDEHYHFRLVGDFLGKSVPFYFTSFLMVFRSPEPQVAWSLALVVFAGLLRITDENRPGPKSIVIYLGANALLAGSHVMLSIPAIALQLGAGGLLWLASQRSKGQMLILGGGCGLAMLLVFRLLSDASANGMSFVFRSSAPSLAPSVAISALMLGAFLLRRLRAPLAMSPRQLAGLVTVSVPLAVMNQQLVTGWMIPTKDFELYCNYQFLAFGAALLFGSPTPQQLPAAPTNWRDATFLPLLAVAIATAFAGQAKTYELWHHHNLKSLVYADAIYLADSKLGRRHPVIVDDPMVAALTSVRLSQFDRLAFSPTQYTRYPAPQFAGQTDWARHLDSPLLRSLYGFHRTRGSSAQELEDVLKRELARTAGAQMQFAFNCLDVVFYCSNARMLGTEQALRLVPAIIRGYRQFLAEVGHGPILFVTSPTRSVADRGQLGVRVLARAEREGLAVVARLQD